jgi:putative Ig domain-containing protein
LKTKLLLPSRTIHNVPAPVYALVAALLLACVLATTACSNTMQSMASGSAKGNAAARIALSPGSSSVPSGGTLQFTALVEDTRDTGVRWSTSIGTISDKGLFTAPRVTSSQTVVVVATSTADPTSHATVSTTVVAPQQLKILTSSLAAGVSGLLYDAAVAGAGGATPYQWTITSGALPTGLQLNASTGVIFGVPSQEGTFPFTISLKDAAANRTTQALTLAVSSSSTGSNFDGPAELPRVYLSTALANTPAPGKVTQVNAGGDFQAALNNANCGDTIQLQAGSTFSGVFKFPNKSCDDAHWIIVRTNAPDSSLPPEGTRITPCFAGTASLPGRPAFPCASPHSVLAKLIFVNKTGFGPVVFNSGANHYRLIGLEVTRSTGTGYISELITPDVAAPADHIVLDRLWVHGTAHEETARGIYVAGLVSVAIVDSYFTDFHCVSLTGSCTDAQAIGGGGGNFPAGPMKIVNNFLEASGENVILGGGAATTTPTDIEIRQNHLFKPMTWMVGQPGFVGGVDGNPFIVKNHFELKNAQRVLFEGNIAENTWGGFSQTGYSILLTPKSQASRGKSVCPTCLVTDVTIRYNKISHTAAGMTIATVVSDAGGAAAAGARYSIHDITFDDINAATYRGGGPLFLVMNGWSANVLNNVNINHVTGFGDESHPLLSIGNQMTLPKMSGFTFINNLVLAGARPVWSSGGGITNCAFYDIPITTITSCFASYSFVNNGIIGSPSNYPPSMWPTGNFFPTDPVTVQFVNFNNGNGGDYRLSAASPYKNAGTDHKDLGADINALDTATAATR